MHFDIDTESSHSPDEEWVLLCVVYSLKYKWHSLLCMDCRVDIFKCCHVVSLVIHIAMYIAVNKWVKLHLSM